MGKNCCYEMCNSDSRYAERPHMEGVFFIPFAKPKTMLEKCKMWLKACGRKDFGVDKIRKHTYICSKHFVGGKGPTVEHPNPLPATATQLEKQLAAEPVRPGPRPRDRQHTLPPSKRRKSEDIGLKASTEIEACEEPNYQFADIDTLQIKEVMDDDYFDGDSGTSAQLNDQRDTLQIKEEVMDDDYFDGDSGTSVQLNDQRGAAGAFHWVHGVYTRVGEGIYRYPRYQRGIDGDYVEQETTSQDDQGDTVTIKQEMMVEDDLTVETMAQDEQRDAVPDSYQAAPTTSDYVPVEREHLQANIKQETVAEVFGTEGLSDEGENLQAYIKKETVAEVFGTDGLSDEGESSRTLSVSSEDICRPNNLPVREGAHKTSIDVKQEAEEYRDNTLQSIEHSLPYWDGKSIRSAAISQFARVLGNQRKEEEVARCSTCHAGLPSKALLFKHLSIHTNEMYHKYFEYKKKFYPHSLLRRHQHKHRGKNQHPCSTSCTQAQKHAQERNLSVHGSVVAEHHPQNSKGLSSKCDEGGDRPVGIEMRNGRPMFICPICPKGYTQRHSLNKHKRIHIAQYPHSCLTCHKEFASEYELTRHMVIHTIERPYECPECDKRYTRKDILKRHLKAHAGLKCYECPQCNRGYSRKEQLVRHMDEYNHGKRWQCTTCDKSYESEIAFKVHMNTHSRVKQYDCSVCYQAFMYKRSLDKHMKKHQKHHQCGECDKEFLYEKNLEKHMRKHTGEKPFKCSECQKEFMFQNNLQKHMERHTAPRPYPCPKCDKGFYFKSNLNKHVRKHTAPKPFQCSYCNKGYNFKRELRRHTKSAHPEEDDFQCSECYKSFTSSSSIHAHMKTHFEESSYECPKCKKKHPSKFALSVHMSKHIGIARHKCGQCKKMLTSRRQLALHIMCKHHGNKLHKCSQCEKRYITTQELIRHENTHSKEQPSESGVGTSKTFSPTESKIKTL